jgi:uncharacterized repeat protein (TIGR04076 family)
MKKNFSEEDEFTISVLKADTEKCRMGLEVGDTFTFEFGTPADLCGDVYFHIYPILHTLRGGGDMKNFGKEESH